MYENFRYIRKQKILIKIVVYYLLFAVTKFVRIGIADKNDTPPYFDKFLYETEIDESADLQTTVLTINAKNHNETTSIRYAITGGNVGNAFGVHNTTGTIYVASPLDYETRPRINFNSLSCRYRDHTTQKLFITRLRTDTNHHKNV
ncbi:hypothetical protein GQX74_009203 [Glossina fuscipes]|nr:hypothetical protein GQX74_009203 [Glossina fuscipes]